MEEIFNEEEIFEKDDYKLVLTIVKRGYETEVLEAAKRANHYGATVLQAKGVSKIQKKFLGFSVDPEATIVMMIVKDDLVLDVMKKIYAVADFKSEAKGMIFALPVELVAGLNETYDKIDLA